MSRRRYSDEERANALAALAANGGNVDRTARELGLPRKTLEHWAKGDINPVVAELGQQKKVSLADRLEEVALALVAAMPRKLANATLQQIAVSLGIAVEKMQLLRGAPTSITEDLRRADLSKLTDAQLDQLDAILRDAEASGGQGGEGTAQAG